MVYYKNCIRSAKVLKIDYQTLQNTEEQELSYTASRNEKWHQYVEINEWEF